MTIALKTLCAFLAVINNAGYYKEKTKFLIVIWRHNFDWCVCSVAYFVVL